jgi:hypothetical protein
MISLTDLGTVADVAQQVEANPFMLAGRLIGLSGDEQKAGVPMWAWVSLAFVGGAVATLKYGPQIRAKLKQL